MNKDIIESLQNYLNDLLNNIPDISSSISKLKYYKENSDGIHEELRFLICLNLGKAYCFDGLNQDLSLAEKFLKEGMKFPSQIIKKYESELFFNLGHLYARKNIQKKAKEYFIKYNLSPNKLNETKMDSNFYSFRKINNFTISDLVNDEITLSNPEKFNDPYDTLLFQFLDYRKKRIKKKSNYDISPMIEAYNPQRVRCFSVSNIKKNYLVNPVLNRLLWSHYADEFRGICVLYDFHRFQNGVSFSVKKESLTEWFHVDYLEKVVFSNTTKATRELLLATKHNDWKYENEVRLIHYDPTTKDQHIQLPLQELEGKIKAIIFGSRCSAKDEQTIRALFKEQDFFFRIRGIEHFGPNDNIYDLKIDDEEKWEKLNPY